MADSGLFSGCCVFRDLSLLPEFLLPPHSVMKLHEAVTQLKKLGSTPLLCFSLYYLSDFYNLRPRSFNRNSVDYISKAKWISYAFTCIWLIWLLWPFHLLRQVTRQHLTCMGVTKYKFPWPWKNNSNHCHTIGKKKQCDLIYLLGR